MDANKSPRLKGNTQSYGFDSLARHSQPNPLSRSQVDPVADTDLNNYTDLLLKKEQEIREISILKLKKLESVVRTKDVQINDLESQVDALNKQVFRLDSTSKENAEKVRDYEQKFNEVNQLFSEVT